MNNYNSMMMRGVSNSMNHSSISSSGGSSGSNSNYNGMNLNISSVISNYNKTGKEMVNYQNESSNYLANIGLKTHLENIHTFHGNGFIFGANGTNGSNGTNSNNSGNNSNNSNNNNSSNSNGHRSKFLLDFDSMIGRTAHICFLEQPLYIDMLIHVYKQYFVSME